MSFAKLSALANEKNLVLNRMGGSNKGWYTLSFAPTPTGKALYGFSHSGTLVYVKGLKEVREYLANDDAIVKDAIRIMNRIEFECQS